MHNKFYDKLIAKLPFIFFVFLLFTSLFWFRGMGKDHFFYIHDQSPFIARADAFSTMSSWSRDWLGSDGGMNIISSVRSLQFLMFDYLGFSIQQSQKIYFTIIFTLPYITMFFFLKVVLVNRFSSKSNKEKDVIYIASVLGAFLYSLNLYLILLWHAGHYTNVGPMYALFPLVLVLLWNVLVGEAHPFINGVKAGLLFLIFGQATPPNMLALAGLGFILLLFVAFFLGNSSKNFLDLLYAVIVMAAVAFLVNLWWIVPYFKTMVSSSQEFINAGDKSINYVSLTAEPLGLTRRLFLFMKWTIDAEWHGRFFHSFFPYYLNIIVRSLWSLLVIFSFSALLFFSKIKNNNHKMVFIYAVFLLFISLLFSKGTKSPFEGYFIYLYENLPLFNMFRSPGNKFGSGVVMALSVMLAVSSYYFLTFLTKKKYQRLLFVFIVLLIISIYGFPLLTGIALREVVQGQMPSNITRIPSEYSKFADLVNEDSDEYRILHLPGKTYGTYLPGVNVENGYEGPDMLEKLLTKPSIHYPQNTRTFNDTAEALWQFYDKGNFEIIKFLNIRYIVQRCDITNYEYLYRCNDLIDTKYGEYLDGYNKLKVFRVSDDYFQPRFYMADEVKGVQKAKEIHDLVNNGDSKSVAYVAAEQNSKVDFDYENTAKNEAAHEILINKLANHRYILDVKNSNGKELLAFLDGFHPGWKIYFFTEKPKDNFSGFAPFRYHSESKAIHVKTNGYANGWILPVDDICSQKSCEKNTDGSYNYFLVVDYFPQQYVAVSILISVFVLVSLISILFVYERRTRG